MKAEEVSAVIVDAAFHLHKDLGPGLLESVYVLVLSRMLEERGLQVQRQLPVDFVFHGIEFNERFRVDLLVEGCVVVEIKSVETILPVHSKQLLTYLRLLKLTLGLLINSGSATFREGIKRFVNNHFETTDSRLKINNR